MPNDPRNDITPIPEIQAGYVVLPFEQDQFNDFIKSLLGSPQSISRRISGAFEIEPADLKNLYSLILQRVNQQNRGMLAQFTARIVYSDESSVEITTLDELLTYQEIRPVVSRAVHLKWDFVVHFPDKTVPEKQRIQVSFVSSAAGYTVMDEEIAPLGRVFLPSATGHASFRIEHTARTWGADIEALLSAHISSLMKRPSPLKGFVSSHSGKVALSVGAIFFLASLVVAFITTRRFSHTQVADVRQMIRQSGTEMNSKLDYLTKFVAGGAWSQYYFAVCVFLVFALILAIVFATWVETAASRTEPSFVLLTNGARSEKEKVLERLKRKWISFLIAVGVSIATGVAGNIIFARIFS